MKTAITHYRRACDHDSWIGCVSLADLTWRAKGLAHDENQVLVLLAKAAGHNHALQKWLGEQCKYDTANCGLASLAARKGLGGKVDLYGAAKLRARGCAGGDVFACHSE